MNGEKMYLELTTDIMKLTTDIIYIISKIKSLGPVYVKVIQTTQFVL